MPARARGRACLAPPRPWSARHKRRASGVVPPDGPWRTRHASGHHSGATRRTLSRAHRTKVDLGAAVPTVPNWRLATLPRFISADEVLRLVRSCDRRTHGGRRDHAVLLLLARLGLRAGEVAHLKLEDIDWDAGELTIHGKGQRQDRIPLPPDVGRALADYIRRDRPRGPTSTRTLRSGSFLRQRSACHPGRVCAPPPTRPSSGCSR